MIQLDMPLAIVLVPIIGILGYWIQAYFMKKKELAIKMEEIKQGLFSAMVDEIPYVFIPAYTEKLSIPDKFDHARKFFGPYAKLWLFAGDDAIQKMNEVIDMFGPPPAQDKPTRTIASFILSMRKELGIKTSLTEKDVRFVIVIVTA